MAEIIVPDAKSLRIITVSFSPEFVNRNWAYWKGPREGKGLEGDEESNKTSRDIAEVDFNEADFFAGLETGEDSITGEKKLDRIKGLGRAAIYGTTVFMGLWKDYNTVENKSDSVLEKLFLQKGITCVDFFDGILRHPLGFRSVLYFNRNALFPERLWFWNYFYLRNDWQGHRLSAVSQKCK